MRIYRGLSQIRPGLGDVALTIGNYDGVHVGHRAIVDRLVSEGQTRRISTVLLTFDPHPVNVLRPERRVQRLFPIRDMEERLGQAGVDFFVVEAFTAALSHLSASQFLNERLLPAMNPRLFAVGHDFAFGAGRGGNLDFLKSWCEARGTDLFVQKPIELDGRRVSSRSIRDALTAGEVESAKKLLGRAFYLDGVVEKGAGRGKTISVPTMNLRVQDRFAPKIGVYVTRTTIEEKSQRSVSNLGVNPTFSADGEVKLETHVFDFSGDVYGKNIRVEFLHRIRDEKKFASVDELKTQIAADMKTARGYAEPTE